MDVLTTAFGISCVVTTGCAVTAKDGEWHDAVVSSALLTASWATSNVAWLADMLGSLPVLDAALAVYFLIMALDRPWGWRGGLVLAIFSQLVLHVVYAALGPSFYTGYAILLNATFGLQLVIVASTGDWHVYLAHLFRFCRCLRGSPLSGPES